MVTLHSVSDQLSYGRSQSGFELEPLPTVPSGSDQPRINDEAFDGHQETDVSDGEVNVVDGEDDEEEDAPICSAASSTRCSTSAGRGEASVKAQSVPVFDFSKLEQQTPARPTAFRHMSHSGFDSPMNEDSRALARVKPNRSLDAMDLFSSPMLNRADVESSVYRGAFAPMSINRSALRKQQHPVSSSGGSVSHWSSLQTPSDISHYSQADHMGARNGNGLTSSPGGLGLFSSPHHPNFSKSLGLASSGGVEDCLVGFLGSSWDVQQ